MSLVTNTITESRYDYCHIDLYTIILLIIARWQIFLLSQIFFISLNPVIHLMAAMCSTVLDDRHWRGEKETILTEDSCSFYSFL